VRERRREKEEGEERKEKEEDTTIVCFCAHLRPGPIVVDDDDVLLGRTSINLTRFDSGSEPVTRLDTRQDRIKGRTNEQSPVDSPQRRHIKPGERSV
jgi:hypothetical protein